MEKSEEIGALVAALAMARGKFTPLVRTKTAKIQIRGGGEYNYSYADLDALLDATTAALNDQGLVVIQTVGLDTLMTILAHKSGQFVMDQVGIATALPARELGSDITYKRRYAYSAMVGIAPEDDTDGEGASKGAAPKEARKATAPSPDEAPGGPAPEEPACPECGGKMKLVPAGTSRRTGKPYSAFYGCAKQGCKGMMNAAAPAATKDEGQAPSTPGQHSAMFTLAHKLGYTDEQLHETIAADCGADSIKALTFDQAGRYITQWGEALKGVKK
jgi:hypothetical protein